MTAGGSVTAGASVTAGGRQWWLGAAGGVSDGWGRQ